MRESDYNVSTMQHIIFKPYYDVFSLLYIFIMQPSRNNHKTGQAAP